MKRKYIVIFCLIIFILGITTVMKFFSNKSFQGIRTILTVHAYQLKVQEPYNIPKSYLTLEILEINKERSMCLLEISSSLSGENARFWISPNSSNPEIRDFIGAKTDVIMVTKIKEDSVIISVKGCCIETIK